MIERKGGKHTKSFGIFVATMIAFKIFISVCSIIAVIKKKKKKKTSVTFETILGLFTSAFQPF